MLQSSKKIISWFLGITLLLVGWFAVDCYQTWYLPLKLINKSSVKVYPGSGVEELAKQLQEQNLLRYPHLFLTLAHMTEASRNFRFGEYAITPGMNIADLLRNIRTGRGMVQHKITFIEGWTFVQLLQTLAQDAVLKHSLQGKTPAEIMALLGAPEQKPEGLFFPSTYHFIWGNSDIDVLRMSYKKMQNVVQQEWAKRDTQIPFTDPYQALVLASLIEKETALANERTIISGVLVRRLQKGMRLQVDPTVLYGLGKAFGLPITKADLAADNPYNTYRVAGLPPTPINMPGLDSIRAAMHPDSSAEYFFYVARGDGSHVFSKTYAEHLIAVKQYREGLRQNQPQSSHLPWRTSPHAAEWLQATLMEFGSLIITIGLL